jgi:hypothetical protein
MYPLFNFRFKKKYLWIIFIVGNFIAIFKIRYLFPIISLISVYLPDGAILVKTLSYVNSDIFNGFYGITTGHIERCLMYILICSFSDKLLKSHEFNKYFVNSYVFYFISFTFFSEFSILVERLTLLFAFSYWLLCPNIFEILPTRRFKQYYMAFFFVFAFLKITVATNDITMKYSNILWSTEDRYSREREIKNYMELDNMKRN